MPRHNAVILGICGAHGFFHDPSISRGKGVSQALLEPALLPANMARSTMDSKDLCLKGRRAAAADHSQGKSRLMAAFEDRNRDC